MMLGNVAMETTDDEIKDFLVKYGFPAFSSIERHEGSGTRPAALIKFENIETTELEKLKGRIHEIQWKGRKISARVVLDSFQ
jgi:hypothetical protein